MSLGTPGTQGHVTSALSDSSETLQIKVLLSTNLNIKSTKTLTKTKIQPMFKSLKQ